MKHADSAPDDCESCLGGRRAAAVSLIIPARRGSYLNDLFEIADALRARAMEKQERAPER